MKTLYNISMEIASFEESRKIKISFEWINTSAERNRHSYFWNSVLNRSRLSFLLLVLPGSNERSWVDSGCEGQVWLELQEFGHLLCDLVFTCSRTFHSPHKIALHQRVCLVYIKYILWEERWKTRIVRDVKAK